MKKFIKKEFVLCIAFTLALMSTFITPPSKAYFEYIDYSVISLLFCLMVTVQGFSKVGVFGYFSNTLTKKFTNTRSLSAVLMLLCFFMSMFITNDVALLTFVPLTISLFKDKKKVLMRSIILETAAANLGSMATPIGNPQNLFIYSHYNYTLTTFCKVMLPVCAVSLLILLFSLIFVPSEKMNQQNDDVSFKCNKHLVVYSVIFIMCLCTVARIFDYRICLIVTIIAVAIFDIKILKKPDYALLATFISFFLFVGNVSSVDYIQNFLNSIVTGRELIVACGFSQVISNVPCAIMISGFTDKADAVLMGVNIGGMGTLIASLASLISYKLYANSVNAQKGKYFVEFTVYNFAVLAVLIGVTLVI